MTVKYEFFASISPANDDLSFGTEFKGNHLEITQQYLGNDVIVIQNPELAAKLALDLLTAHRLGKKWASISQIDTNLETEDTVVISQLAFKGLASELLKLAAEIL